MLGFSFAKERLIIITSFLLALLSCQNLKANSLCFINSFPEGQMLLPKKKVVLDTGVILRQEVFKNGNTIYVIKNNLTLVEDVTIPEGCVLEFDGGLIQGKHILSGNGTTIHAGVTMIFSPEIKVMGTWNLTEIYPEWFGAKGDGKYDDAKAINKCLIFNNRGSANPIRIVFTKNEYFVDEIIDFSGSSHLSIEGTNKNIIKKTKGSRKNMFDGGWCKHVRISNLTLDGSFENWDEEIPVTPNWAKKTYNACIIGASNTKDITVDNCVIKNFYYGVFLGGAYEKNKQGDEKKETDHISITNCIFKHNKMACIDTYNRFGLYINNNYFIDNGNIAVHIEPTMMKQLSEPYVTSDVFDAQYPVDGVNICNNTFVWTETPATGIKLYRGVYSANVTNNHFINGSAAIHSDGTKMFTISNNTVKNGCGIRLYGNIGTGSIYGNTLINVTSGISCYNDASTMGGVDIHNNIIILKEGLTATPDYFRVQNSKYHDNIIRGYFDYETWKLKGVLNIGGASNCEIYNNKLLKSSDSTIPFFVVPITNQKELSAFIKKDVRIYDNIYQQKIDYEFSTDVAQTRPNNPYLGQSFYDLNLNKLIVYTSMGWVDAFGNAVN